MESHRGFLVLFVLALLVSTLATVYNIVSVADIRSSTDPTVTSAQNKQFSAIALGLNLLAWVAIIVSIGLAFSESAKAVQMRKYVGVVVLSFIAMLLVLASSILLFIAVQSVNQSAAQLSYVYEISAGVFGIITAFLLLIAFFWGVRGLSPKMASAKRSPRRSASM